MMVDLAAPRATRLATPRWLDARLALGVLLVLLSIVAGARLFASADNYTSVYVAAHDLVPGEHVTTDDLAIGRVRLDGQGSSYIAAGAPPVGYVVTRFVGAREFVPVGALGAAAVARQSRIVSVPVAPGHGGDALDRGDLVDVYVTPKVAAGEAAAEPRLVIANVAVEGRDGGSRTFAGSSALAVTLAVPADHVAAVVRAVESGSIDLVTVPPTAAVR
jgi:hypothetical protein